MIRDPARAPSAHPGSGQAQDRPALPAVLLLECIVETNRGWEAWVNGRGYREGACLADGTFLERITPGAIVVRGPGGSREIHLPRRQARE